MSRLDPDLMHGVFAITGAEGQAIDPLVQLALRDEIPLAPQVGETHWLHGKLNEVASERADLLTGEPPRGRIAELEQRKQELCEEITAAQAVQTREQTDWKQEVDAFREEASRLDRECAWIHEELQAVESDLTELQRRMWEPPPSPPALPASEESDLQEEPSPEWMRDIEQIDARIAHLQQVLRDLADSRRQLSLAQADLVGTGTADGQALFDRQRASLSAIERRVRRLAEFLQRPPQVTPSPDRLSPDIRQKGPNDESDDSRVPVLNELHEQIALLCQDLGSQQTAHAQTLLRAERKGIDRCERELIRQIQRLRRHRDELLHAPERTAADRMRFRTQREALYCRCEGHPGSESLGDENRPDRGCPIHLSGDAVVPIGEPQACDQRTFPLCNAERSGIQSEKAAPFSVGEEHGSQSRGTREADEARCREWLDRRDALRERWQAACRRRNEVRSRLRELERQSSRFAADSSVQQKRYEYAAVEQQLADAREQWDSLAVLKIVLQKTQQRIQGETPAEVIRDASEYLKRLTDGRYHGFRYRETQTPSALSGRENGGIGGQQQSPPPVGELLVINDAGTELPLHTLSRGTLEQAAFSLRLALHHEYRRRGIQLPLILDDVLTDSDEQRLRSAAEILTEVPGQVLFFTCQEHLADLFESLGAFVHELPGSLRHRQDAPESTSSEEKREFPSDPPVSPVPGPHFIPAPSERVQPDEPHWLQSHSPASSVPSLGEQMARRLGALGVRCVADLIELDPEATEIPLDSLQISAATLRQWQAEARLLVCVPDLTGRDGQMLVACGIQSPAELAEADAADLHRRIRMVQSHTTGELTLRWLSPEAEWPSRETVERWTRAGRKARSYRQARDASVRRRLHLRSGRTVRIDPPHTPQTQERSRSAGETVCSQDDPASPAPHVRLHQVLQTSETAGTVDRNWQFTLRMDSPVLEAPSIGPKTAERLERIGVMTVSDLVHRDASEIARRLDRQRITEETVQSWQEQARLVCQVPDLRERDAQVLVTCGITSPEEIVSRTPAELFSIVGPFVSSRAGQRLLRSAPAPGLDEVTGWIARARHALELRAA
jgi:hypothetical protein